jgi:hypothetical protein
LVIGKCPKPRCFKGVSSSPAEYKANRKAWMTEDTFGEWLLKMHLAMDREKKREKYYSWLTICSLDLVDVDAGYINLEFLPPNFTTVIQPLDQRID